MACSVIAGCAIVIAPSGGEKDTIPPMVLKSTPENYATNFTEKEIVIEFDEFIKLKDLYNTFIVSPPLNKKPDITIKGKSVVIKLDSALPADATVNFNFGNSIVDLHEDNPIRDFHYVVSTGSYVDSLSISGMAITASTLSPADEVWVLMYDCQDYSICDSLPSKIRASYLTKTDKNGIFSIQNIRKGSYKVFALVDKNRNKLFDLPNESIGFIGSLVEAGDSSELKLDIFDLENGNQKITNITDVHEGLTKIAFKLPVADVHVEALNFSSKTRWEVIEFNKSRDTMYYWNTSGMDSLKLYILDERYSFEDTIVIRTGKKKASPKLKVTSNVNMTRVLDIGKDLQLLASTPLTVYDALAIKLYKRVDSVTLTELEFKVGYTDESRKNLALIHEWKPEIKYELKLEENALTDFFKGKSDTMSAKFTVRKEDYYGHLTVNISLANSSYNHVVQLLDAKGDISKEDIIKDSDVSADGNISLVYQYLTPGKYRLKVIYDENNSDRWDTGNHSENRQPERIGFAKETILVRSNWDQVLDWKLD